MCNLNSKARKQGMFLVLDSICRKLMQRNSENSHFPTLKSRAEVFHIRGRVYCGVEETVRSGPSERNVFRREKQARGGQ